MKPAAQVQTLDQESNPGPFGAQADLLTIEHHRLGPSYPFLNPLSALSGGLGSAWPTVNSPRIFKKTHSL